DTPRLGGEPEAHVERDGLRADLQHRGQRARILRRLHSKGREVLRGQLEGPSPLECREASESWDPNDGRIAKLRMGGREPRQILHSRSRWARPTKALGLSRANTRRPGPRPPSVPTARALETR